MIICLSINFIEDLTSLILLVSIFLEFIGFFRMLIKLSKFKNKLILSHSMVYDDRKNQEE